MGKNVRDRPRPCNNIVLLVFYVTCNVISVIIFFFYYVYISFVWLVTPQMNIIIRKKYYLASYQLFQYIVLEKNQFQRTLFYL